MKPCTCGCGQQVKDNRMFVSGHNLRGLKRTQAHRDAISRAQTEAWRVKRRRLPLGSTYKDSSGYVRVKVVSGAGRWALEHVLVVEAHIGRKLTRGELVHHIDGNRANNALENLFLCRDTSHHMEVHRSQDNALRVCLAAGIVKFTEGRYEAVLP